MGWEADVTEAGASLEALFGASAPMPMLFGKAWEAELVSRIVAHLPRMGTFVELFGAPALALAGKGAGGVEILNDADREHSALYRTLKKLTPDEVARLQKLAQAVPSPVDYRLMKSWGGMDDEPLDAIARAWRVVALKRWGTADGDFNIAVGKKADGPAAGAWEAWRARLEHVKVTCKTPEECFRAYDSADTLVWASVPATADLAGMLGVLKAGTSKWVATGNSVVGDCWVLSKAGADIAVADDGTLVGDALAFYGSADGVLRKALSATFGEGLRILRVEKKKAEFGWTKKEIGTLPDVAFAVILPGGEAKDGVTTPQKLRKFAHHGPEVRDGTEHDTVNHSRLAKMLSTLAYSGMPKAELDKARKHLEGHAKALKIGAVGHGPALLAGAVGITKGSIELDDGEDIYDYMGRVEAALWDWLKSGVMGEWPKDDAGRMIYAPWCRDVYADAVMLSDDRPAQGEGGRYGGCTRWRVPYTQNDDGTFTFGKPQAVKEVYVPDPEGPLPPKPVQPMPMLAGASKGDVQERDVRIVAFGDSIQKAVWDTALVNGLPDAAFAYITPGGKKDDQGKTTPRTSRYFPHHNAEVTDPNDDKTVDLPHLRNALARLQSSNLPAEAKAKALAHLQEHAKRLGVGEAATEAKAGETSAAPEEERYVLGAVLVPNDGDTGKLEPDTQGDIYSAGEIRKTAHAWLAEYGNIGLVHTALLQKRDVVPVESYLLPDDMEVGGIAYPAGTWMLAVKIRNDELWEAVKAGKINAYSIGGLARRTPVDANTPANAPEKP